MKIKPLTRKKEFTEVFKRATKEQGDLLAMYAEKTDAEDIFIGMILSKKYSPSAVMRNYIKRCVHSVVRETLDQWQSGARVIIRLKKDIRKRTRKQLYPRIREEVLELGARTGTRK